MYICIYVFYMHVYIYIYRRMQAYVHNVVIVII